MGVAAKRYPQDEFTVGRAFCREFTASLKHINQHT